MNCVQGEGEKIPICYISTDAKFTVLKVPRVLSSPRIYFCLFRENLSGHLPSNAADSGKRASIIQGCIWYIMSRGSVNPERCNNCHIS